MNRKSLTLILTAILISCIHGQAESTVAVSERNKDVVVIVEKSGPQTELTKVPAPVTPWRDRNSFAVRTNLLYDVFLLPTVGVEWRISHNAGIKLDGSYSYWGNKHGKVQKMWMISPEVRWYLGNTKRFYVGAGGNYVDYNVHKYMIGGLFSTHTGHQGSLWNAGVTTGYQLRLSNAFSMDFNIGLGYTRSEYDSFNMQDDVRFYKGRNQSKNFWGPTQAGISLMWHIGGEK